MRAFVGLELPDTLRDAMAGWRSLLEASGLPARWVARDSLHLTLRFLGDADVSRHRDYIGRLAPSLLTRDAFSVRVADPDLFPAHGKPRIVLINLACDGPDLDDLAQLCETAARDCGYPPEARPFRPHVTIGRIKDDTRRGGRREWNGLIAGSLPAWQLSSPLPFMVREAILFESRLGAGGSKYEPLCRMEFAGSP